MITNEMRWDLLNGQEKDEEMGMTQFFILLS